ncbi:hypothetical protein CANARDRAFT_204128 [[Candida] arabinofermentans NRRL YB-2248]|uniref:Man(5)GlcNAc(2)-PP-dolichol translocation protein RFT1 n=1 Tax=[Candida] arabinofermentans NRRL YB-2248 TaxID=983967 RepID=A0A1E4STX9_9ASCO|nr:hypothetical protein CANARDRAFT_204128 [[Candida] arabinofermentans NRRL YB-2248]
MSKGDDGNKVNLSNGASVLMAGQMLIKVMTFTMNQLLIQYMTPTSIGLTNYIEFFISYLLFLSRESIRLVIERLPNGSDRAIINLSYLPLMIYTVIHIPFFYFQLINNEDISSILSNYKIISIVMIQCSIIFELLVEPMYNLVQHDLNFKKRTKFESIASFTRCFIQFIMIINMNRQEPNFKYVISYIVSQLCYSITLLSIYFNDYYKMNGEKIDTLKLYKIDNELVYFPQNSINQIKSLFLQLVFKNFLTEGDKFIINLLFDLTSQGYYSIVSNYGSLIARMIFQPIEESTRINITKLFSTSSITKIEKIKSLNENINSILIIYIYLLSIIVIFAPINSPFLLPILFKSINDNELIRTFQIYWLYIPFLAINGILEALLNSIITSNSQIELNNYSKLMMFNSLLFFITCGGFVWIFKFGLIGLVLSNFINMSVRIVYCCFKLRDFIDLKYYNLKKFYMFGGCCFMVVLLHLKFIGLQVNTFKEFLMSGSIGVLLVVSIIYLERNLVLRLIKRKIN